MRLEKRMLGRATMRGCRVVHHAKLSSFWLDDKIEGNFIGVLYRYIR